MKLITKIITKAFEFALYRWLLVLILLFLAWIRLLKRRSEDKKTPHRIRHNVKGDCAPIKAINYKRADPLIYSQRYLMNLGMAVTWDNPDIQLYENNVPVSSHALKPGTRYQIRARISNASTEAPVVGMPVKFSFLDFGAGNISIPIGQTLVNVGVLGGVNNPAYTETEWVTPMEAGHYCLQVKLIWADDINPENNLGQENTNVVYPESPAQFNFKVHNEGTHTHRYQIEVDTYEIPDLIDCEEKKNSKSYQTKLKQRHSRENYPIPQDWSVEIFDNDFSLNAGESKQVNGQITPPEDFKGKKAFNFNVFTVDKGKKFVGGVTIYVEKN